MNFAETVFLLPPQDGGDVGCGSSPPAPSCPSPGTPSSARRSWSGAALGTDAVTLETAAGLIPVVSGARAVTGSSFGRMSQPIPAWEPFDRERELLGTARRRARPSCPSSCTATGPPHVYVELESEDAVAALAAGHGRAGGAGGRRELLRRRAAARGRRGCSTRPPASPRIRPPARPRARWRSTSPATAGSASARRSRSARAPRSAGRRCSTHGHTATGDRIDSVEVGGVALIVAEGRFRDHPGRRPWLGPSGGSCSDRRRWPARGSLGRAALDLGRETGREVITRRRGCWTRPAPPAWWWTRPPRPGTSSGARPSSRRTGSPAAAFQGRTSARADAAATDRRRCPASRARPRGRLWSGPRRVPTPIAIRWPTRRRWRLAGLPRWPA